MKKKNPIERGLDRFIPSKVDELELGKVVAVFCGRGCNTGIVKELGKRTSLVRFTNGQEERIFNSRLRIIKDKRWIAETMGKLQNTFPTEKEVFGGS